MILIGQFDSPFVRRVGIALKHYGISFEHRPWSVFGNADEIAQVSPIIRVPTLVLDDGTALNETFAILSYVETLRPVGTISLNGSGADFSEMLRIAALASGLSDKAVSLFYEQRLHEKTSDIWVSRCTRQIMGVLAALESARAVRHSLYWFGNAISHADIAVAASLRHFNESQPDMVDMVDYPALSAHCRAMEELPVFREISQPFLAPA